VLKRGKEILFQALPIIMERMPTAGMTSGDASSAPLDEEPFCSIVFSAEVDDTTNSAQNSCHTSRQVEQCPNP
jgi:hypothetical protein